MWYLEFVFPGAVTIKIERDTDEPLAAMRGLEFQGRRPVCLTFYGAVPADVEEAALTALDAPGEIYRYALPSTAEAMQGDENRRLRFSLGIALSLVGEELANENYDGSGQGRKYSNTEVMRHTFLESLVDVLEPM